VTISEFSLQYSMAVRLTLSRKNVNKGREDANEEKSLPYTDVGCSHRNILKALKDLARNFPSFILCLHILKFRKH